MAVTSRLPRSFRYPLTSGSFKYAPELRTLRITVSPSLRSFGPDSASCEGSPRSGRFCCAAAIGDSVSIAAIDSAAARRRAETQCLAMVL